MTEYRVTWLYYQTASTVMRMRVLALRAHGLGLTRMGEIFDGLGDCGKITSFFMLIDIRCRGQAARQRRTAA